jgi:hypothetical protein
VTDMVSSAITGMTNFVGSLFCLVVGCPQVLCGQPWTPMAFLYPSRAMLYIYPTISPLRGYLGS